MILPLKNFQQSVSPSWQQPKVGDFSDEIMNTIPLQSRAFDDIAAQEFPTWQRPKVGGFSDEVTY